MADCTSSTSSWSTASGLNQRYRDLDTAAMHFWIDKRGTGAGGHGGPHGLAHGLPHGGRYGHRVSASLASNRLPPGATPQRRRRPSRTGREGAVLVGGGVPKATTLATTQGGARGASSAAGGDSSSSSSSTATPSSTSSAGSSSSVSRTGSSRVAGPGPPPGPMLSRAARAHLALPRPRPHLAYIGSTGSGIRAHGTHGVPGGLGGVLVDLPLEGGHGALGSSSTGHGHGPDRGDVFGLGGLPGSLPGSLPLPVHAESPPVLMDRFTCGLWASFALASVFVAGTKFYLDFQVELGHGGHGAVPAPHDLPHGRLHGVHLPGQGQLPVGRRSGRRHGLGAEGARARPRRRTPRHPGNTPGPAAPAAQRTGGAHRRPQPGRCGPAEPAAGAARRAAAEHRAAAAVPHRHARGAAAARLREGRDVERDECDEEARCTARARPLQEERLTNQPVASASPVPPLLRVLWQCQFAALLE